jgi:hypothetical protein
MVITFFGGHLVDPRVGRMFWSACSRVSNQPPRFPRRGGFAFDVIDEVDAI